MNTPKVWYILRIVPFSWLETVVQQAETRAIEVLAVNGLSLASMDENDREYLAQYKDTRYLFKVGAIDLEDAGDKVNLLLKHVVSEKRKMQEGTV